MLVLTDDNCIIDTEKYGSNDYFREEVYWNGFMHVGKCTYRSGGNSMQFLYPKDGRYYLVELTVDSRVIFAKKLCLEDAARWMLFNNHHDLPNDLKRVADSIR